MPYSPPFRLRTDIVRDPIYNYIDFTKESKNGEKSEKDFIDSVPLQRLRQIHQLQSAWMVYPGAEHTRFQHSLGTMHLSGLFANQIFRTYYHTIPQSVGLPNPNSVVEELRLAGLFHDIGHGPFGHLLDWTYFEPSFDINHEMISKHIILKEFEDDILKIKRSPMGPFSEDLDVNRICNLIKFNNVDYFNKNYWKSLYRILHGIWTSDSLDFIQRDSYYCGVREYGIIDYERLLKSSIMNQTGGLALYSTSESALESFIFSRIFMFTNVYYHRTSRAIDISISKLLPNTMNELGIYNPIDEEESYNKFLQTSEYRLFSDVIRWANQKHNDEKKKLGEKWKKIILERKIDWRFAYKCEAQPTKLLGNDLSLKKSDVQSLLEPNLPSDIDMSDIYIDIPSLDVRSPLSIKNMDYGIYDPELDKIIDHKGTHHFMMSLLPRKIIWYSIFAKKEKRDRVKKVLSQMEKGSKESQDTSF